MLTPHLVLYIIIGITVFDFLVAKTLDYLNDRRKEPQLPPEAEGIYDETRYAEWLEYDKANARLGSIGSGISIVLVLAMLVLGGFGWLDEQLRMLTENPVLLALLYFATLGLASSAIGLPFEIYGTFVIEEKFGFNKSTLKTFVLDHLKGAALGILIGGPIATLVVWFFYTAGDWFWLYTWVLVSLFSIFTTMFAASWIMPLFNKFTPLEEGPLREAIEEYCAKVGFKLKDLYVMDGSRRSTKANAFFSGLGPKKKIVLYDTLIEKHTNEEIVAVLAHEIGHYKKQHTKLSLVLSIVQTGIVLYIMGIFLKLPAFSLALGAEIPSFHVGIIAFGIIFSPISTLIGLAMNALSRKHEFEADAFAKQTYGGKPLAASLRKLTSDSLSNLRPHPAYVFFYYSHPPVLKRVGRLEGIRG